MFRAPDRAPDGPAVGDQVSFLHRGRQRTGIVVRAARATVAVVASDGTPFRVSRTLLTRSEAESDDRLHAIAMRARALLSRHRLDGWSFTFDHAKRRGGACHYGRKEISLSLGFAAAAADAEVEDTILHEIAHALVGRRHNHDAVWQAKARAIGCTAQRCHSVEFTRHPLVARCVNGCFAIGRHRRRRNMRCRRCGGKVAYEVAA
ncbi:MAG: SprT-like domain-containing protein [Geminicoccaceae bacterium]